MQNTLLDSLHYFRMDSYKCKSILRNRVPRIKVCEYDKRYKIYRDHLNITIYNITLRGKFLQL